MSEKNVNIDSLQFASSILSTYIQVLSTNLRKMNDAARDCNDNMEHDTYSRQAMASLAEYINEMEKAVTSAEEIKEKIDQKIKAILASSEDW